VGTSSALGLVIGVPATVVYIITGSGRRACRPLSLGYVNLLAVAVITPFTTYFATVGARIAHAIPMRALRACFGRVPGHHRPAHVHRPRDSLRRPP
jgi:uncharacterized membrane protein YfcA